MTAYRKAKWVVMVLVIWAVTAGSGMARVIYYRKPSKTPAPAQSLPVAPPTDPNDKMFKDIPIDTVFVYPTDKLHKWFQWIKISDTEAKSVVSAAKPTSSVQKISHERMIYVVNKTTK
jgi:hypothetical protein